jgi:hypothetical protein
VVGVVQQIALADAPADEIIVILHVEDALISVIGAHVLHLIRLVLPTAYEAFEAQNVVH